MVHPDSILVGHSLGAVTIAHLLARWPGLRVRTALLIAPADPATSDRTRRRPQSCKRHLNGVPQRSIFAETPPSRTAPLPHTIIRGGASGVVLRNLTTPRRATVIGGPHMLRL